MSQVKSYGNEQVAAYISNDGWYDDEDSPKGKICLPHSCDEWIIGGEKEARELINDLEELIKKL